MNGDGEEKKGAEKGMFVGIGIGKFIGEFPTGRICAPSQTAGTGTGTGTGTIMGTT